MDEERVWIKDNDGNIYYCEIKSINRDENYRLTEYEVFPIIGCFTGFTTLLSSELNNPAICMIWKNNDRPFGKVCYDLDKLISNGR